VELKKSTAVLRRTGETLCGFLNGDGGWVLIGITPVGKAISQSVSDRTLAGATTDRSPLNLRKFMFNASFSTCRNFHHAIV
jgi:predicted HTH transcriptional regulator